MAREIGGGFNFCMGGYGQHGSQWVKKMEIQGRSGGGGGAGEIPCMVGVWIYIS